MPHLQTSRGNCASREASTVGWLIFESARFSIDESRSGVQFIARAEHLHGLFQRELKAVSNGDDPRFGRLSWASREPTYRISGCRGRLN